MIRTPLRFAAALATAAAVASPAAAQSWQVIGTPANNTPGSAAYWNNRSDDNVGGAICNAGSILTNSALTAAGCSNQAPAFIPLSPAPLTTGNVFLGGASGAQPGAFRFAAGSYNFGFLGRVAGDKGTSWGIVLADGSTRSAATLLGGTQTIGQSFAMFITQALPTGGAGTVFRSDLVPATGSAATTQQFAVFTSAFGAGTSGLSAATFGSIAGTVINTSPVQTFYVGMEDNVNFGAGSAGNPASDRDYNDILVTVQAVPEPSTYALMATGMALMGVVARRRRTA